jgi:DNA-binding MltR family transcriptional regulator
MPTFDEEDEVAFFEHNPERGVAIALPAIIENHLTAILKVAMRPDGRIWNDLFSSHGPLGNFGIKIRLAYMLGLIESTRLKDLTIITKIRNEFAHKISIKTFDQSCGC